MGGGGLALRVAATWALARAGFSDTELGAGVQGRVLGVADMDGDGTLDVVTASADRFTVVYNTAEGFVATDSGADGSVAAVAALALADLDGDGAADVLLAAGTSVQIWQFDGDMTAPLILRWQTSGNSGAGCLDVLNFNGDGDPDFFAGRPEENLLSSYRRLGDDFVEGVVDNDAGGVVALVHADVNGDGDVDAFAAYGALNAVAYLKNDGAGNEASFSRVLGTEDGMAPNAIFGNVDVDGDGNLDLLVTGDDGRVYWYENIDLHEGGNEANLRDISSATDGPRSVQGVDVDGDGDVDVLVASYFDDAVTWFENQGEDAAGTLQFAQHAVKSTSYARGLVEQVTGTWGDICLDETSLLGRDGAVLSYGDGSGGDNSASDALDTSAEYISRVRQASYSGSSQCDEGLGGGVYYEVSSIYETSVVRYFNFGAGGPEDPAATTAGGRATDWAASWPCQIVGLVVDGDDDPATVDTIAGVETNCDGGTFPIPTGTLYDDTCVVVAADLDGDGDADVVSASSADGKAWWHESVGDATAAPTAASCGWAARDEWSTSHTSGWFVARVDSSAVATDVPLGVFIDGELWGLSETSEALPDSSGAFAGLDCYSTSIFSDGASAGADITYKLCLDGAVLAADAVSLDAAETLTDGEYGSTSDPVFLDFPSPTAPTLVARYAFDGGDASDDSGNGMTGTIHGATATVGFDGGGALAFDGVDDYVELPAAVTATLGAGAARTVCLWAKIGAFDGGGLFSYGAPADGREFSLRTYGDVVLRVQYYGEAFDADVALAGSDDGAWHHYCLAYDGAAWTLYYDGSQAQTATLALDTDAASATFKLGVWYNEHLYFSGSLDDVWIYAGALDAAAVSSLYETTLAPTLSPAPTPTPRPTRVSEATLVAYYSFDDGTAADDVTGGLALDGTITGATATAGPGGSRALAFDGVDDIATFPAAVTADVLLASSRTFCLWATVDAWNGAALFSYGAADHWDDTTYFAFQTSHEPGEFKLSFQSSNVVLWGSDDGAWHHYCVTYDDGWLKLYFDGEFFDSSVAYLHTGDGQNFMVGGAGSDAAYFDGAVDDLYVYSSALDAASIQHIFELTGLPTASPTLTPPPTRVSQSTLVGYYSFDDGTAAEDTDSSLNGTVFGATATTGPDGSGALSFDGSESAAAFPTALTWGLLGIAHRTVCLWATIDAWNGAALFWYGTLWSASDNQVFALKTSSPGSVDVYFNGAADAGDVALAGSDDGAWHHYCVAYDGAFWFLYFDGQQASTGAAELNTGDEFELQVGGLSNWGVYFDGAVDDLYVYSSALDAASIQHIFELTGTPTAAPTLTPPPPPSNGELCDCTSYANGATEYDAVLCVPNSGQCRPPNDGDGLCSSDAPACVLSDAPTPHPTSLFSTLAPTPASLYYDCRRMTNTICDDDLMDMCVVGPRDCGDLDEETCFYEDCNPCAAGAGDAMCACGILSVYGDYTNLCCWGGCGECGGQACDERPGGPDKCCHSNINSSGDICQVPSDTACAVPDPLDDTTIRVAVAAWAWGPETATATYGDIGSWDTSMVTDFSELFCASADDCGHTYAEAATFDEDVGYWDVSAAVTMKSMFRGCEHFDRDLGGWDVSAVTDMSHMFASAGAFDRDLGSCQRFFRVLTGKNRRVP